MGWLYFCVVPLAILESFRLRINVIHPVTLRESRKVVRPCTDLHRLAPVGHLGTPRDTFGHLPTPSDTSKKWSILKVSATLPYPCTSFLVHPLTVHRCASGAKLRPLPADVSAISSNSMAFAAPCCLHLTSISFSIHFIWAKG